MVLTATRTLSILADGRTDATPIRPPTSKRTPNSPSRMGAIWDSTVERIFFSDKSLTQLGSCSTLTRARIRGRVALNEFRNETWGSFALPTGSILLPPMDAAADSAKDATVATTPSDKLNKYSPGHFDREFRVAKYARRTPTSLPPLSSPARNKLGALACGTSEQPPKTPGTHQSNASPAAIALTRRPPCLRSATQRQVRALSRRGKLAGAVELLEGGAFGGHAGGGGAADWLRGGGGGRLSRSARVRALLR